MLHFDLEQLYQIIVLTFYVQFGVWAQEDFINQTDYALEKGAAILDYFDDLYGMDVKYPMAKMGKKRACFYCRFVSLLTKLCTSKATMYTEEYTVAA